MLYYIEFYVDEGIFVGSLLPVAIRFKCSIFQYHLFVLLLLLLLSLILVMNLVFVSYQLEFSLSENLVLIYVCQQPAAALTNFILFKLGGQSEVRPVF